MKNSFKKNKARYIIYLFFWLFRFLFSVNKRNPTERSLYFIRRIVSRPDSGGNNVVAPTRWRSKSQSYLAGSDTVRSYPSVWTIQSVYRKEFMRTFAKLLQSETRWYEVIILYFIKLSRRIENHRWIKLQIYCVTLNSTEKNSMQKFIGSIFCYKVIIFKKNLWTPI